MPSKPKGKSTKGSSSDAKPPRPPAQKQQQEEQEREEVFEQGEGVLARDSGELYDAKVRSLFLTIQTRVRTQRMRCCAAFYQLHDPSRRTPYTACS